MVAPVTWLPGPTSTGTDSPVTSEASTAEEPSDHDAVGGDLLTGAHDDDVVHGELIGRDLHLGAVDQHGGVLGAEVQQRLQGVTGLGLGVRLEEPAQQKECGDHAGHLEVQAAGAPAAHLFHAGMLGQARIGEELPGRKRRTRR